LGQEQYSKLKKIVGLATAATLWTTAAIGVTVGVGFYILAIVATALTYLSLKLGMFTSS
jgi:putative Mg2+ transporter-C (MgtC) family protein